MITVLHISPTLVPLDNEAGGVANIVRQLALSQSSSGRAEVLVLCSDTERQHAVSIDIQKASHTPFTRFVVPQYKHSFAGPFWPVKRYLDSIIAQRKNKLVVHVHTCFSSITDYSCKYLARANVPFLLMPHGKTSQAFRSNKRYQKLLWHRFVGLSSSILRTGSIGCNSPGEVDATLAYFQVRSKLQTFWAPNGFPSVSEKGPDSPLVNNECLRLLYLGYLDPRKNLINILRAVPLVKSTKNLLLTIAGPDAYGHETALKREVKRLNIQSRVNFIGRVDGPEKLSLYRSSTLLLLPSSGEGQPLVLGEALSAGLPIIFSKQCNFSFAATCGAGIQLESNDPESIAESIDKLWSDKRLYNAMKQATRRVAEENSWSNASNFWLAAYSKILSSKLDFHDP